MKTFKVGDKVTGPYGKGEVVCVGNLVNSHICHAYDNPGRTMHDGHKHVTGFQYHTNNCYWSAGTDLDKLKAAFKGNVK